MSDPEDPSKPPQPRSRNDFEIALICALEIECNAVEAIFDGFWEGTYSYGKAIGDPNSYTTGWIASHNVVLAYMPGMGGKSAASVSTSFRSSFPNIKIGLVVGICGAVPFPEKKPEILLGDLVISTAVIEYSFGRQFPDKMIRKDTLEDNLGRPNSEIRAFLVKLKSLRTQKALMNEAEVCLKKLQENSQLGASYPGINSDILFRTDYPHKHQVPEQCSTCAAWVEKDDKVCDTSRELSCDELGCNDNIDQVVEQERKKQLAREAPRNPTETSHIHRPRIHFGRIASGDLVMKSGHTRDEIAKKEKVIAFEMEGAGVWENFPTIVIKAACDYSDSHKNKAWQKYSAAVAAAHMRAVLVQWRASDSILTPQNKINTVPKTLVHGFLGRHGLLDQIDESLRRAPDDNNLPQVLVLQGMGGQGKTQLALQACKRSIDTREGIFWVDATTQHTAERAFESLADKLNSRGQLLNGTKAKVDFVFNRLTLWEQRWLLVLDNYDEPRQFTNIKDFMPYNQKGTIIITTRNEGVGRLGDLLRIPSMIGDRGEELLLRPYWNKKGAAEEIVEARKIVDRLGGLALALDQAASYINFKRMTFSQFMSRYESKKKDVMRRIPDLFEYHKESEQPVSVFTTWEMSFEQIEPRNAERKQWIQDFLAVSACLDGRNVTEDMFRAHQQTDYDTNFPWEQLFTRQSDDGSSSASEDDEDASEAAPGSRESMALERRKWSSTRFRDTVSELRQISILQPASYSNESASVAFSIHPVVKDWLQKRTADLEYRRTIIQQGLKVLGGAVEDSSTTSSLTKRQWLLEHLDACNEAARSAKLFRGLGSIDMQWESLVIARFMRNEVHYSKCASILERLKAECEQQLPAESYPRLKAMSELASTYIQQQRWKDAESLVAEVLEIGKRLRGEENNDTLVSMVRLASVYMGQERYEDAEA